MLTREERKESRFKWEALKRETRHNKRQAKLSKDAIEKQCLIDNGYHDYQPNYQTVGGVHMCTRCERYWRGWRALFEPSNPTE